MYEIVITVLSSLGGTALIVAGLANHVGKIWADRIAQQTLSKYQRELKELESKHELALAEFKRKADIEFNDRERFGGISKDVYQEFFKSRVATYIKLLELKNKYISDSHEDVQTEENEAWGEVFYFSYVSFRKVLIENQLYISNDLGKAFHKLRMEASKYIKEADLLEMRAIGAGAEPYEASEAMTPIYGKLAQNTYQLMNNLITQLEDDVSKLRSRIDIDKI